MMRASWVLVALAFASTTASADPLDKAKVVKLETLRGATVLGLHVAEIEVGDDGALRLRAGIEVKCGTVKKLKKKEGKCVAALPLADVAVAIYGGLQLRDQWVDMTMAGAVEDGWLVFRAERLATLVAAATVSSSATDRLSVTVTTRGNTYVPTALVDWPDPWLAPTPPTVDVLASYQSPAGGADEYYDEMGDHECGAGHDHDDEGDPVIYAELPVTWLAYAGARMLEGQAPRLLKGFEELATRRPAAYFSALELERAAVGGLDAASAPLEKITKLAAEVVPALRLRLDAASGSAPAWDRAHAVYRDLALLAGVHAGKLPAEVADALPSLVQEASTLVGADLAQPPSVPADAAERSRWESSHEILLRDPAHPTAFVAWIEARDELPYLGSGAYEQVLRVALADGDHAKSLIAVARGDIAAAKKAGSTGLWVVQDQLAFAHFAYEARGADTATTELLTDLGRMLVAPAQFELDVAKGFVRAYDAFLTGTDAGRDLALELAPKLESRARTIRAEQLASIETSRATAASQCTAAVKEAKELLAKWNKKEKKLKAKEREKLQARATSLGYEISNARYTLDWVVTELDRLSASEVWSARSDRDACVAPW